MKTIVILNPKASQGKAILMKENILSELSRQGIDFEMHISKSADDIIESSKHYLSLGFKNFLGAGGDGTLHYIAQVIAGTDCNLGIIPIGSGNDIIKTLGISNNIEESIKIIKKGKIKRIDIGFFNDSKYFIGYASSGFDSEVLRFANNTKLPIKGALRYNLSVYKTLITFKPKVFSMEYDGIFRDENMMFSVVSNLKYYGGGMKISPSADPSDGKFDVCLVKAMGKMSFIKAFPKVYAGEHTQIPQVEIFRTQEIKIDCVNKFEIHGDGEYLGVLPAKLKILPGMLNIFIP